MFISHYEVCKTIKKNMSFCNKNKNSLQIIYLLYIQLIITKEIVDFPNKTSNNCFHKMFVFPNTCSIIFTPMRKNVFLTGRTKSQKDNNNEIKKHRK